MNKNTENPSPSFSNGEQTMTNTNEIRNPEVKAAEARRIAQKEARDIRSAITNTCFNVYALDARDGKEYRIVAASTKTINGVCTLMGQEPRQGIWFPISTWVQK